MKPNQLYLKPVGGLCNRMRAIDTAATLANQLGKRLVVFWGRDSYLNCRYSDLFKPSEHFAVIEEQQWFGKKALFPYLPGSKPTSTFRNALYNLSKAAFSIKKEIWFEDFEHAISSLNLEINPNEIRSMKEYEEKSLNYITTLLAPLQGKGNHFICTAWKLTPEQNYARHFTPIDSLNNIVAQTASHFATTIGVHIRRGDHAPAIAYSNLEKFTVFMNQELKKDSHTTFYLATDCSDTEQKLLRLYPGRIIKYPKASYSRNSKLGIQDALVDLYTLSKTKKVLGSFYSSFSQVATEISGIEEVTIY